MSSRDNQDIVIRKVKGGAVADDLLGCFFTAKGDGTYKFHDHKGSEKAKDLKTGSQFSLHLDDVNWILTITSISDSAASGTWKLPFTPDPGDVDDQTFQAQAGTTVQGEESATSAVA